MNLKHYILNFVYFFIYLYSITVVIIIILAVDAHHFPRPCAVLVSVWFLCFFVLCWYFYSWDLNNITKSFTSYYRHSTGSCLSFTSFLYLWVFSVSLLNVYFFSYSNLKPHYFLCLLLYSLLLSLGSSISILSVPLLSSCVSFLFVWLTLFTFTFFYTFTFFMLSLSRIHIDYVLVSTSPLA